MTTAIEPRNDMERLLQDMMESGNVDLSVSSGDGLFSVNLSSVDRQSLKGPECDCHDDLWILRTENWTVYTRLATVQRVSFVRQPDPHRPERESLSIRMVGPDGNSLVRGNFGPLYDEQGMPIPAVFARWEQLRSDYGGKNELSVENGSLTA